MDRHSPTVRVFIGSRLFLISEEERDRIIASAQEIPVVPPVSGPPKEYFDIVSGTAHKASPKGAESGRY